MPSFFIVHYLHILSAIIMLGASSANGVARLWANATEDGATIAHVSRLIMVINRRLVGPALLALVASGILLARIGGWSLSQTWLTLALILGGGLWAAFIAGYWVERRMEKAADAAHVRHIKKPDETYWRANQLGIWIGGGAALMSLVALYLMLAKPP